MILEFGQMATGGGFTTSLGVPQGSKFPVPPHCLSRNIEVIHALSGLYISTIKSRVVAISSPVNRSVTGVGLLAVPVAPLSAKDEKSWAKTLLVFANTWLCNGMFKPLTATITSASAMNSGDCRRRCGASKGFG